MNNRCKITDLSLADIEAIEKTSLLSLCIAAHDFSRDAWDYFRYSKDDPKDIAEDISREMLDKLGGYGINQRIYGNVDYRKARYLILPDYAVHQALLVDSKAEKSANSATLQMSQVSMSIRQIRGGDKTDIQGSVAQIQHYGTHDYLSTTLLAHYCYSASPGNDGGDRPPYTLQRMTLVAVPNGLLQDRYNPDAANTIWIAGRDAPSRGESFRARLSFNLLRQKSAWRIQTMDFDESGNVNFHWTA